MVNFVSLRVMIEVIVGEFFNGMLSGTTCHDRTDAEAVFTKSLKKGQSMLAGVNSQLRKM